MSARNANAPEWRTKLLLAERNLINLGCRGSATDVAEVIRQVSELMEAVEAQQVREGRPQFNASKQAGFDRIANALDALIGNGGEE